MQENINEKRDMVLDYKSNKEVATSGLLGFFIGIAVIVPGISGATIAILLKLYDKLLFAIGNILGKFKKCIVFLLPIAIGIAVGFSLGFLTIQQLLDFLPFTVTAGFAGLMIGAFPAVGGEIKSEKFTPARIALFAVGFIFPVAIVLLSNFLTEGTRSLENLTLFNYITFVLIGAVVALTQIVPGLSATAMLMAFGYFRPIVESVKPDYWKSNPEVFIVYACLGVGFIVGIVAFSKFLSALLAKARKTTFFPIVGMSLGSIVTMFFNSDILATYKSWASGAGNPALDLTLGIVLFAAGAVLSYLFVRFERKRG